MLSKEQDNLLTQIAAIGSLNMSICAPLKVGYLTGCVRNPEVSQPPARLRRYPRGGKNNGAGI